MAGLKESLVNFREPVFRRVQRSVETYTATANYVQKNLTLLVEQYASARNDEQTQRLIRDDIDNALRRYHGYCIKERIGAHYIDPDCEDNGIFEHMIPANTIRNLLLKNAITTEQACNMPMCKLSKSKDDLLREAGWGNKTPDIYNFWLRYTNCFEVANFTTYDGTLIDTSEWTLDKHFEYFLS